jgi:oxaloacetate decarboxylase gamma subunit
MDSLMSSGLNLMIYGMGTVIVFLILLIGAMRILAWFVRITTTDQISSPDLSLGARPSGPTPAQVAAITAAVNRYRSAD